MFYEKPNAKTTMENPVIVLEVVKPQEVDEFSDDDSVEIIPALKRGGVDADSDDEGPLRAKILMMSLLQARNLMTLLSQERKSLGWWINRLQGQVG
jgi:hypothetical protein